MSEEFDRLVSIMARLRNPKGGCPWDLEQDFKSIAPCTLEEAYEVVEAIEQDDAPHLCEELGDLLLQVVFHAQMAKEKGLFSIDDVAKSEADKMVDRHPHVFGERVAETASDVLTNWEADKAEKRGRVSALDGVSTALPAITRALKLQKRAARIGFDWKDPKDIFAKLNEEIQEVKDELVPSPVQERVEEEIGDLLFVVVNLARRFEVDPERALRRANRKFESRFRSIEKALAARGEAPEEASLDEMEELWVEAKKAEKVKKSA